MNMQRKLGMKRSFNCDDLSSIVGLDQHHHNRTVSVSPLHSNQLRKRVKRQRAISTDSSSSCPAVCCCCEEEKAMLPLATKFMPSMGSSSPNDDTSTPLQKTASSARLISPATSHVTVVTPELNPALPSDELSSLPCFPSLSRTRNESSDFPATAALERFMLKQRSSPTFNEVGGDFSPSFEEKSDEEPCHFWPKLDHEDSPYSPRNIEEFPWHTRRVSMASSSRKSSSVSVDSGSNQVQKKVPSPVPFSFLSMASFKLKSSKTRVVSTVNQITEALERL